MKNADKIVGLPWQLAEGILQAAAIPYVVNFGKNYNRFFEVASDGAYVARVREDALGQLEILLYRPMKKSRFETCDEVRYAEIFISKKSENR